MRLDRSLVLVAGWGAVLALVGCGKSGPSTGSSVGALPVATVRALSVSPKQRVATEEVIGTVRAKLRSTIEAKISGRVEKCLVVEGQAVKAGELLVELDAREIRAHLEQAQAQREQAESDLKRLTTLVAQNAVTRQEFEAAQSRARVTIAAVSEAETMLAHARIVAPFDGVITRKLADVGDLAAPGRPLLEMQDPASLRFEADVPESLFGRIRAGAKLPVRLPSLEREWPGVITEIAPSADPVSRTFLVKLELPFSPELRAGLFGRVAVPLKETRALRVPASAVVVRGQMEIVFVVADRKAWLRLVRTGKTVGEEIELLSGVSDGETVVVSGVAGLADGQPVEVKP